MENPRYISAHISLATFVRFLAITFILLILWILRDIIILIFLSMVLAATISPLVRRLERVRVPRIAGVTIIYCVIISLVLLFVVLLIPAIRSEASSLTNSNYVEKVTNFFSNSPVNIGSLATKENVSTFSKGIFAGVKGVIGGFASFLLVLVITFYFTIDEKNIRQFWVRLVPKQYRERVIRVARLSVERIGSWFRGQLLVSLLIGVVSYIAFYFLGVPDALLLALIGAVAAFIPVVGAVIGIAPAVLLALTVSQVTALIVLAIGVAIHEFIANAVVPKVMSKAVGLNSVVIVIVMLLGAQLAGGVGLVLAIPTASVIDIIIKELKPKERLEEAPHGA